VREPLQPRYLVASAEGDLRTGFPCNVGRPTDVKARLAALVRQRRESARRRAKTVNAEAASNGALPDLWGVVGVMGIG
jgi:hypothetical protein